MHVAIERNSWRLPQDDVVQVVNPKSKIKDIPDELAYAGLSDGQYWRSVILALLVIIIVIAGIASAILSYGFVDELLYWSGKRLCLEDILNTTDIFPDRLPSMWISSTGFVYQNDDGDLSMYNTTSNNVTVLISNYTLNQINVKEYKCSRDLKYILLKSNIHKVFKNTYTAHVTIYTVKNGHQTKLIVNKTDVNILELQSADWAGNTNNIIFVKDNDLYIKYEVSHKEIRITKTGIRNLIYNGIPDWLYQEEIFLDPSKAYWPSADGSLLLFATFNDSNVENFEYPWMEDGFQNVDPMKLIYTKSVRYPTPGTNIPKAELWLFNITLSNETSSPIKIEPPAPLFGEDHYIVSVGWVNDSSYQFSVVWMSRIHNFSIVNYYEAPNWKSVEQSHVENAPANMWLEVQQHPVFAPDGQSYLLLAPVQYNSHFSTHIKHVTQEDKHVRIISYGFEVLQILAWDTVKHIVYYIGTDSGKTGEQHMYAVNDQTSGDIIRPEIKCITCEIREQPYYKNCSYFTAYFNSLSPKDEIDYYVLQCEEQPMPFAGIHHASNGSLIRSLFDEHIKIQNLERYALPKSRFDRVILPNGYNARVQLLMPPSWRPELRDAAFPVIVQVDGRPNSQLVTKKWKTDWGLYLSVRDGVVYIKLDVRGSKGQSTSDLYKHLGDIEVSDQIFVIKELLKSYKYLDGNRIGVWGWGYGGYVTTLLMGSQYHIFKCGIAVSPIADWRYYNSAFAEKIFGLKTKINDLNYIGSDLKTKTDFIASDSFYIIQGLADQSIPYQHGVMLANAMTRSNKLFRHQVYANEGFELQNVLVHMYRSMEDHFKRCLTLEEDDSPNHV
ncbi:hypothetical protein PGB90_006491 [Kerria lacca]